MIVFSTLITVVEYLMGITAIIAVVNGVQVAPKVIKRKISEMKRGDII